MRNSLVGSVRGYLRTANRWLLRTPERALDEAYEAALTIRGLEDTHFGGNRISVDSSNYGKSTQTYFRSELKRNLDVIKIRLTEFKASSFIVRLSNRSITEIQLEENSPEPRQISVIDQPAVILKKLRLIDEVVSRYEAREPNPASLVIVSELAKPSSINGSDPTNNTHSRANKRSTSIDEILIADASDREVRDVKSITDKTGVLPRSILETVDRIKRELDPEAEQEVVKDFRKSKARTIIALRLVLLLIIIPLLTQQVAKNFIVGPIVDHFRGENEQVRVFLNEEMEEEALVELERFQQRLQFEILIGKTEPKSEEEIAERVREKALELQEEFIGEGSDAIKNVFSDIFALAAFVLVLVTSRREIEVLKSLWIN